MSHNCSVAKREVTPLTVSKIANFIGAKVDNLVASKEVRNIWMDSRKIESGDVFLALEGELVDGHDFVEVALNSGAVAAIIDKKRVSDFTEEILKSCLVVENPLEAVQKGANLYRRELDIPVICVTGSNGKTSTTSFLKEILSLGFNVGSTYSNWNNHIGVALSIFRFRGDEDIAILELGANHTGEIELLAEIAEPDFGIITNIGYAHIGYFQSLDKTANAKFELARDVKKRDGILLLNGDDKTSVEQNEKEEIPAFYFGTSDSCAIKAENIRCDENGNYSFIFNEVDYKLNVAGYHHIFSLLPALFIASQMNIKNSELVKKVAELGTVNMRGNIEQIRGVKFILDCYNANPSSMRVATKQLVDIPSTGRKIAVVGDMFELEDLSEELHQKLGVELVEAKVDKIIAVGKYSEFVLKGAKNAGINSESLLVAENSKEAGNILKKELEAGDLVLVKGSRGVGLEKSVEMFREAK
jgi:UDP-N-acetylmuramoyl-tripeptide--D-alanyl-D-alanine ligase